MLLLRCVVCASGFTASHSHSSSFMCSFSRWCPARDVVRGGGVGVVLQVGALRDRLAGLRQSITEASSRQQRGTEQQQHRLAALARDSKDVDSRLQACLSRVAEAEVLCRAYRPVLSRAHRPALLTPSLVCSSMSLLCANGAPRVLRVSTICRQPFLRCASSLVVSATRLSTHAPTISLRPYSMSRLLRLAACVRECVRVCRPTVIAC